MKARKKDSNDEWKDVNYVRLKDGYYLISADLMEFKYDNLSTEPKTYNQIDEEKHWQDLRERAAIAIMAGIIANSDPRLEIATDANKLAKGVINFADALVKILKGE